MLQGLSAPQLGLVSPLQLGLYRATHTGSRAGGGAPCVVLLRPHLLPQALGAATYCPSPRPTHI